MATKFMKYPRTCVMSSSNTGNSRPDFNAIDDCVKALVDANPAVLNMRDGQHIYDRDIPNDVDITPVLEFMEYVYDHTNLSICRKKDDVAKVFRHHGYDITASDIDMSFTPLSKRYSKREYLIQGTFHINSLTDYTITPPGIYPSITISAEALLRNVRASSEIIEHMRAHHLIDDAVIQGNWGVYLYSVRPAQAQTQMDKSIAEFLDDGMRYSHHIVYPFRNCQSIADQLTKISEGKYATNVGDPAISLKRFFDKSTIPDTTGDFYFDYQTCIDAVMHTVIPEIYPQCAASLQTVDDSEYNFEDILVLKFTDGIMRYTLSSDMFRDGYENKGCRGIISKILSMLRAPKYGRWSAIKYPKK